MKRSSLLLFGSQRFEWIEEELPPLGADEILVQTVAGAVSVGTELPIYLGISRSSRPIDFPCMTGYESLGRVIECGGAVRGLAVGDRILSFYGHRTHAIIEESRAIRLIEPRVSRRALALHLGAMACWAPEEAANLDSRFPVGFECSSQDRAFDLLQQKMAPGGRICILSDGNLEPLVLSPHFHEKELRVTGSNNGEDYPGHAAWFFTQVRQEGEALESLYELETQADRLFQAFEYMGSMPVPPLKVFVRYELAKALQADVR